MTKIKKMYAMFDLIILKLGRSEERKEQAGTIKPLVIPFNGLGN